MQNTLQERLERYLSEAPGDGWVRTTDICKAFGLASDRPLRAVGDRPGLCTPFAISGDKGLKHMTAPPPPNGCASSTASASTASASSSASATSTAAAANPSNRSSARPSYSKKIPARGCCCEWGNSKCKTEQETHKSCPSTCRCAWMRSVWESRWTIQRPTADSLPVYD